MPSKENKDRVTKITVEVPTDLYKRAQELALGMGDDSLPLNLTEQLERYVEDASGVLESGWIPYLSEGWNELAKDLEFLGGLSEFAKGHETDWAAFEEGQYQRLPFIDMHSFLGEINNRMLDVAKIPNRMRDVIENLEQKIN